MIFFTKYVNNSTFNIKILQKTFFFDSRRMNKMQQEPKKYCITISDICITIRLIQITIQDVCRDVETILYLHIKQEL